MRYISNNVLRDESGVSKGFYIVFQLKAGDIIPSKGTRIFHNFKVFEVLDVEFSFVTEHPRSNIARNIKCYVEEVNVREDENVKA